MDTAGTTTGLMVIVIVPDVAVAGLAQSALEVITQDIICPPVRLLTVKSVLLIPAFVPSTFHWYAGLAPPLVGVAVKVIEAPSQDGLVPAVSAMDTEGVTAGLTDIEIPPDVAVAGLTQAALEVITHETTWPFVNAFVVNVGLLVPAFTLLTFH